jgi:hypothetical protein
MALRRRSVYGLIATGLVLAAGLSVGLVAGLGGHKPGSYGNRSFVSLSSAQQIRLEHGLEAQNITAQAAVVATEIRAEFLSRGRPLLPPGSEVRIEPATFAAGPSKTATVVAVVSGSAPGKWKLLLVSQGGNWLLIGTRSLP